MVTLYSGFAERTESGTLHFRGLVSSLDGRQVVRAEATGAEVDAAELGRRVGEQVLSNGGREILDALAEQADDE